MVRDGILPEAPEMQSQVQYYKDSYKEVLTTQGAPKYYLQPVDDPAAQQMLPLAINMYS